VGTNISKEPAASKTLYLSTTVHGAASQNILCHENIRAHKLTLDGLQLQCCGVTGPRDWAGSRFNKAGRSSLDLGVTSVLQIYSIPTSCCREGTDEEICKTAVSTGIGAQISNVIYSEVSTSVAGSYSQFHVSKPDLDFLDPCI
jgi:hypothetical protein